MKEHRTAAKIFAGFAIVSALTVGIAPAAQAMDSGWNGTIVKTDEDSGWNGTIVNTDRDSGWNGTIVNTDRDSGWNGTKVGGN